MKLKKQGSNLFLGLIGGALWVLAGCVPTTPDVVFHNSTSSAATIATAKDESVYAVGTTWIDSGTANGTVPVMLISKFDRYGTLSWQKRFPQNPSSEWLAKYASLAKRDFDRPLAYSVSEGNNGEIYVSGAAISDSEILAATPQHDPAIRAHDVYLLKYDAAGSLIWSQDIGSASYSGVANSQLSGTLEKVLVEFVDDKIYARGKVYDSAGNYVKLADFFNAGVTMGDLKAAVVPNCMGSGHASASCGEIEGYLIFKYDLASDQRQPPLQVIVPGTRPVSYDAVDNSLAILIQTNISNAQQYPPDYAYTIEQYNYANGDLVAKNPLPIESLLSVNFSNSNANSPKLFSLSGNFYLSNYLAGENKLLVAKLDKDQNITWSQKYDVTGMDQYAGDSTSVRSYIEEDGNLVVIFICEGHNIFRIAQNGTLISHDYLKLPNALRYYTSAANGDYIGFSDMETDLSKAFVPLADLAAP